MEFFILTLTFTYALGEARCSRSSVGMFETDWELENILPFLLTTKTHLKIEKGNFLRLVEYKNGCLCYKFKIRVYKVTPPLNLHPPECSSEEGERSRDLSLVPQQVWCGLGLF